jgi:hypothetical protein
LSPACHNESSSFRERFLAYYPQLQKFGQLARRAGALALSFAVLEVAIVIWTSLASRQHGIDLLILFSMGFVQVLPGAIVLMLADAARRGNPTAFFAIVATAILAPFRTLLVSFLPLTFGREIGGFMCDVFNSLPLLYLLIGFKESVPEVRQLIRRRREDRSLNQRSFAAVMPGDRPPVIEPVRAVQVQSSESLPPIRPQAQLIAVPTRRRRAGVSHYMHEAAGSAKLVGVLSVIRGVILVSLNGALRYHDGGQDLVDVSMQNVLIYYVLPAIALLMLAWRMDKNDLWAFPYARWLRSR